jgi:hypothetical protein
MKAEWERTHFLFDTGGIYEGKTGTGWMTEFISSPSDNLSLSVWYRNIGDHFGNTFTFYFMRGTEKYCMEIEWNPAEKIWVRSTLYHEEDNLNDMEHNYAGIGVGREFGRTKIEIEAYKEDANDNHIAPLDSYLRSPFDISEETPEEAGGLKVHIEHKPSVLFLTDLYI